MAAEDDVEPVTDQLPPMDEADKADLGFGKTAAPDRVARYRQIVEDMATARGTTPVTPPSGLEQEA